jgi:cell division protein FtsB
MPANQSPNPKILTPDLRRNPHLLLAVMIGLCLIFVVSYAGRLAKLAAAEANVDHWQVRVQQAEDHTLRLIDEDAYVGSDAYIHQQARNELGLVQAGDALVIAIPSTPTPAVLKEAKGVEKKVVEKANWQRWLDLFVPTSTQPSSE